MRCRKTLERRVLVDELISRHKDYSYELLKQTKRALDPHCLLNPGKVFDSG
jgi:FAD/FMN-containing dehydrogenase